MQAKVGDEHPTDHAGLEILPFDVCLRLLASVPVGRVGFHADGELVILPVNYVVDGQNIVFRTARGSKLSAAEGQNLVAFEADDYDPPTRSGWSVAVSGHAEAVCEDTEVRRFWPAWARPRPGPRSVLDGTGAPAAGSPAVTFCHWDVRDL